MSSLNAAFRQLIERGQVGAHAMLAEIAERTPNSVKAGTSLGSAYLQKLGSTPVLEHYSAAHAFNLKNHS